MAYSTFYYHYKHFGRPDKYEHLKIRIQRIFACHKGRYGYRRITATLLMEGIRVNHKTVKRLMDELGLKSLVRVVKYHSYKGTVGPIAPNILNQNFSADRPYSKWVTDVTQVIVNQKKCYISTILDTFNGEIISCKISDRPDLNLVMDMLKKAYAKHINTTGIILHSDQGWQYQHKAYQESLRKHGIIQSMSRKGNCLDNAMMENFFGIMKSELLYMNRYKDMNIFKEDLKSYIKYYNKDRIKLRLNGLSPIRYRKLFLSQKL